jgi:hypothetical protein
MPILENNTLIQLERNIANYRENPNGIPYGYPVSLVSDLLDTIRHHKTLKKKYQRLAEMRGQYLMDIFSTASRAVDKTTEALTE